MSLTGSQNQSIDQAALLNEMTEGVIVLSAAGQVLYMNTGAARITGWDAKQALGISANELFPIPGGEGAFWDRVRMTEVVDRLEVINKSGETLTLSITAKTLGTGERLLVVRDVTEVGAAQRLRSYFMANVSHEFRTPLSALSASVELLLDDMDTLTHEEISHLLQSVHYSVTGLQTLIDNLLESTNIESGHFRIRRVPTFLDHLVFEASQVMQPLLRRREQVLLTYLPEKPVEVLVDPTRMTQVLVNLISNASKYSPLQTTITVEAEIHGAGQLLVRVIDQGPGLQPYDREHLFRRFVRLSENSDIQYGAGLGLSVVKAIIDAHGGKVGVDSHLGGGSIFWFEIPLGEVQK